MLRPDPRRGAVLERDHHAGPAPALDQPRGHDPHHSRVPALPGHHHGRAGGLGGAGRLGGERDARLGLTAVAVEQIEFARHLLCALLVLGDQQLQRGVGPAHAPGGVDTRAQPEAEMLLGELGGLDGGQRHQRSQAGLARACHGDESLAHDAPVLVAQRHEVADGGQRGEVEILVRALRIGAGGHLQRLAELEDHPGGAQLWTAVGPERRMHERTVGQGRPGPVVIGDHHVESRRPRGSHLLDRGHPAVDRHEQLHPARGQALHRGHREAVSLVEAARQLPLGVPAQRAQGAYEHRGGADAVDVVVTEHGNSRPAFRCPRISSQAPGAPGNVLGS